MKKYRIVPKRGKVIVQIGSEVFQSHEPYDRSTRIEWRNAKPEDMEEVLNAIKLKDSPNE